MFVNHFFSIFFLSAGFCFSFGKIAPVLDGNASAPLNITEQPSLCKEEKFVRDTYTPWYSLDTVSRRHSGTLRRDSTGRLAYLELHFTLQTDGRVDIDFSEKDESYSGGYYSLSVGDYNPQRTELSYNRAPVLNITTPDIVSPTEFRSFYIKIDDGKLQFGKEGKAPLLSHSVVCSLNYYSLYSFGRSTFRFCPAAVEGSS